MDKRDLNIIIPLIGNSSWIGGLTYQENLIEALKMLPDVSITFTNELDQTASIPKDIPFSKKFFSKSKKRLSSAFNKISSWSKNYDAELQKKLELCMHGKVNALFTLNEAHLRGKDNLIKLYWIPDFQQMHHKEFFSKEDLEKRNARYMEGCELADIIIVSSSIVKKDLEKFAPEFSHKCRVSSFVSRIPSYIWEANPMVTVKKYSLPEKFFYLPNQFWKHKNHQVVFEALNRLRNEGVFPNLVCTGNPNDHRDPEFYKKLIQLAKEMKLTDQVRFLGIVPYEEVMILIRQSVALINPSLFEGWSTTVEEAKSIGKQVILSDIEVHREQAAPNSTFFKPHDSAMLAGILKSKWNEQKAGPDVKMEMAARQQLDSRIRNYAETFVKIIAEFEESRMVKN